MFKIDNVISPLKKDDTVCVVAPGMPTDPENLLKIKQFLNNWGLKAHIPKGIFAKGFISSNSVAKRFEFLNQSLLADECKMIWCIRGGYGAHELLPYLQKISKPRPKIFCGFSDASSLHTFFIQNWGWQTLHGPHLDKIVTGGVAESQIKQIKKIIFGQIDKVSFLQLKPLNAKAEKATDIHSSLVGGNLITLQSHVGTPWELKAFGKILFFEDIGERAYRVRRVLTHFKQLGLFKDARAIVFGDFTNSEESDGKTLVPKLLKDFASEVQVPVYHKLPCGHGKNQWPIPLGTDAQIYKLKNKFVFNISTGISEV